MSREARFRPNSFFFRSCVFAPEIPPPRFGPTAAKEHLRLGRMQPAPPVELVEHFKLTPITDGPKAGGGKKRQRPQSIPASDREQGLRNFSLKVCTVVQNKRETTYTDVADTLVEDILGKQRADSDEGRNIRRCVSLVLLCHICLIC